MAKLKGGSATPVYMIRASDLQENGGRWKLQGGAAVPLYNASTGSTAENSIIVAKSGGDYTTIEAALNAATGGKCIVVYPGTYIENNPLVGKANVTLRSCGGATNTNIVAANANQDMFTSADVFTVDGFGLLSVSGAANWVMQLNAAHRVNIDNCVIFNCSNGLRTNNVAAVLSSVDLIIGNNVGTTTCGVCNNAGNVIVSFGRVAAGSTITTLFDFDGATAISTVENYLSFESGVTTIVSADNSARSVVRACSFVGMFDGFVVQGGSRTEVYSSSIFNAQQDNSRVNNVGSNTIISGIGVSLDGAVRYNLNILSATAVVTGFSLLNPDQINFVSGAQIIGAAVSTKEDDEGLDIYGELHVGVPEQGAESVFGSGDSYTRGMLVYTFDPSGPTYTDVSVAARSASGSTFTFPAVAQNNAIYVASSLVNGGDFLQHFGIKMSQTVATVLGGGSFVVEYWDGGSWTAIDHMSTLSSSPWTQYANAIFERTGSEQIRYPKAFLSGWTKNDPMTLGTDYFWIRFRIASAITTAPTFQQFKLHTNRTEINDDGVIEFFGAARPEKELISHIVLATAVSGSAPANANVAFSATTTLVITRNQFNDNQVHSFGQELTIPTGLDTSIPVTLEVIWYPDTNNAGDVELEAIPAQLEVGDLFDGTVVDGAAVTDIDTVAANSQFETRLSTFDIDIPDLVPGELLVVRIERDATAGNLDDTLSGNIVIASFRAFGDAWRA